MWEYLYLIYNIFDDLKDRYSYSNEISLQIITFYISVNYII